MSYCYISEELCPKKNIENISSIIDSGYSPLICLFECTEAIISSKKEISELPDFYMSCAPHSVGGRGAVFFTLYAPYADEYVKEILCSTLLRLDVCASVCNNGIFVGENKCGSFWMGDRGEISGVLYYGMEQKFLSRHAKEEYMSLKLVNPNISRSYLFGALRYSFELVYQRAVSISPCQTSIKDISLP